MKKAWLSWSSGKDGAFALLKLREDPETEVTGLLTVVNSTHGRVAMHAVRAELMERQAEALGLPLCRIDIPYGCSETLYAERMRAGVESAVRSGAQCMAFGDLFLENVRSYREEMLKDTPLRPLFPLWGRDTAALAREMIAVGQKAIITCVDPKRLPPSFAGREFDAAFLEDLPDGIDPCGENGEFHSFVYDSPLFRSAIPVRVGETVERDGFVFADVLAAGKA